MTRHATDPIARLREAGLRATAPRVAILSALVSDRSHPTVEQVYSRVRPDHPTLSLSTVYDNLEALAAAGLVRRVRGTRGCMRFDGTLDDHDHAICTSCRTVFDVRRDVVPRPDPPANLRKGLRVVGIRMQYDVICPSCAEKQTNQ